MTYSAVQVHGIVWTSHHPGLSGSPAPPEPPPDLKSEGCPGFPESEALRRRNCSLSTNSLSADYNDPRLRSQTMAGPQPSDALKLLWLNLTYILPQKFQPSVGQVPVSLLSTLFLSSPPICLLPVTPWGWKAVGYSFTTQGPMAGPSQVALEVKNSPTNAEDARDVGTTPESGRSPGGGRTWQPTPAFLPGEPHGQRATVLRAAKSWTWLKQFSTNACCMAELLTRLSHP